MTASPGAHAKSDAAISDIAVKAGVDPDHMAEVVAGGLHAVLTAYGMPAALSSGALAKERLGDMDCNRLHIAPLE